MKLPNLEPVQLDSTRDYLQDITLAMSSLQRAFLPKHPKYWQYGLEVSMRGICTQAFEIDGKDYRVLLDLVKSKIRFNDNAWDLGKISGQELFDELKTWAIAKEPSAKLEKPEFKNGKFDVGQSSQYATALWWLHEQFVAIGEELHTGSMAPIFLYPHHFDLSLVWFPWDDDRQVGIGFSTGDDSVTEPYLYLTIYPEPKPIDKYWLEKLPAASHWQDDGFSGAVLPYASLRADEDPQDLLRHFIGPFSSYAVANGF